MRILGWIAAIGIVFYSGYFFGNRAPEKQIESTDESPSDILAGKFRKLTDNEISEYYELKTMEERYRKADEILAKIMSIFVADLGLRLSDRAQAGSQFKIETPKAPTCPSCPSCPKIPAYVSRADRRAQEKALAEPAKAVRPPVTAEELERLRGWKQINDFLDKNKLESFSQTIASATSFSNQSGLLEVLQGRFSGQAAVVVRGKKTSWGVRLRLNASLKDGKLDGTNEVILSERGQDFSTSRGEGDVSEWREGGPGSLEIYLKASPSTYFQLYYIKSADRLIGNVYQLGEAAAFGHIGTVQLHRN